MKRIVCISDTHGLHNSMTNYNKLPEGDILIHSGDFSNIGRKSEIIDFISWLHRQLDRFNHIVFIAGNHDRGMDFQFVETKSSVGHIKVYNESDLDDVSVIMEKPDWLLDAINYLDKRIHYLENSGLSIDGINFWGSPVTPNFYESYWAFNRSRGEKIKRYWDLIPKNTNVLITHGPAKGIGDYIKDQKVNVGCEELEIKVRYELPELKLHVFGHIHDSYMKKTIDGVTYVNASICTEQYVPKNAPIVVEL